MRPPVPADDSVEDLYEHAPCGYLTTRPDGTIVRVNETFLEWTGHERAALVGARRFQDLLTAGGRIYHETHYAPLLRMQGTVREIALEIVCADGRRLPVLVNSAMRLDADGSPVLTRTAVFNASDRQRYEQELLRARERVALLADIGRSLDEIQGVQARAQRLVDALVPRLADVVRVELGSGGSPATVAGAEIDGSAEAAAAAAGGGRVEAFADGAGVALPLRAAGRVNGVLVLRQDGSRRFTAADVPLLQDLAGRAGLSLENARLFEQQSEVALALQRSLLAEHAPADGRYAIATHYRPAVEALEVGGDWYDAFCVGPDRLGICVGDVVGRGIEAASAMGQLRSAVRALAVANPGPAGLLDHLDGFAALVEAAWMATLVYAEVDLDSGQMRYACAGHPPPVVLQPGEDPAILWGGRSTPLRAHTRPVPRAEGCVTLRLGARLLLYTDGLVERRDRPLDHGIEVLMAELDRHRDVAPAAVVDAVTAALVDDEEGRDDVCLLCFDALGG